MWSDQRRRARRREAGSGARWSLFVTLADGMQELVDAVAGRLPANSIRYDAPASAVSQNPATQKWHVQTKAGESLDADAVIVAAPALHAAPLLRTVADVATDELGKIRMLPPPGSASPIGATIFRARRTALDLSSPRSKKEKSWRAQNDTTMTMTAGAKNFGNTGSIFVNTTSGTKMPIHNVLTANRDTNRSSIS